MSSFAVFILTYKRPDKILTIPTLQSQGYTGDIYLIVSSDDPTIEEYKDKYGDRVIVFNREDVEVDLMDPTKERKGVVYARNKVFDIAKDLGLDYFLVLDDDYIGFMYRYIDGNVLRGPTVRCLDKIFELMINFLEDTKALTVAFAQGGDLIGGVGNNNFEKKVLRKAMNSFFCRTSTPYKFYGQINEDVNMYTLLGSQGHLILTIVDIMLAQLMTQTNSGGLTELYLDSGTYVKSFYSVMIMPSAVKVVTMTAKDARVHHLINWNNCVPKIISDRYKKVANG